MCILGVNAVMASNESAIRLSFVYGSFECHCCIAEDGKCVPYGPLLGNPCVVVVFFKIFVIFLIRHEALLITQQLETTMLENIFYRTFWLIYITYSL